MSGDSEEISNQKESERIVLISGSENNVDEKEKKIKRNFCYVCKVQCTAPKNFIDHQKGRKHKKNVSMAAAKEKKAEKLKNEIKSQKITYNSSKDLKFNKKKQDKFDVQDNQSINTSSTTSNMNNSNRQIPRNKRNHYINQDYKGRYSKNQNSKFFYYNGYNNQDYFYNSKKYLNYPQWNTPHSANMPLDNSDYDYGFSNHHSNYAYKSSYDNDFSENIYNVFNSINNLDKSTFLPQPGNANEKSSFSYYSPFSVETTKSKEFESNSSDLESSKRSKKTYSNEACSLESGGPLVTVSNLSPWTASENDAGTSEVSSVQLSKNKTLKHSDDKQIRSRSLSLTETEEKTKASTENEPVDSDNTFDEQKIKKWTDSLLDTSQNKISRLLYPSNYKEKAAVNHLITKFSKSKRQENLTRNIRSNSLGSVDMNEDDESKEVNETLESENIHVDEISVILDSNDNNFNLESSQDSHSLVEKTDRKNSVKINDPEGIINISDLKSSVSAEKPKKSCKSNEKSKDNISTKKSTDNRKGKKKCIDFGKNKKRKISESSRKGKKQKFYSSPENKETYYEEPVTSKRTALKDLNAKTSVEKDANDPNDSKATATNSVNSDTFLDVDDQVSNVSGENPCMSSAITDSQNLLNQPLEFSSDADVNLSVSSPTTNALNQNFEFSSDISVETLIQLFASGSVKVKEEFSDPLMDAIKEISPDELINACINQPLTESEIGMKMHTESNMEISVEKSVHITSSEQASSSVSHSSLISSVNTDCTTSDIEKNSFSEKCDDQSLSSLTNKNSLSLAQNKNANTLQKTESELPSHVNKLIKQLQEISSQEEVVKTNLAEAKSKINEINFLLEEWKRKKKKLQNEEEDLRKQRNNIIKALQDVVKTDDIDNEFSTSQLENTARQLSSNNIYKTVGESSGIFENSSCINLCKKKQNEKGKKQTSPDSEEIMILPLPVKPEPPEIIICDDTEVNEFVYQNKSEDSSQIITNVLSSNESSFFDVRDINAHTTVINCLVVFEDYLYTCSNDNTGKRFSLKDASLTVTYHHSSKNVTEIVVEKVQSEALVLTSCSAKIISLFIASSGTKLKTFFPPSTVMSICKGWGKFFAGLANGTVNVYNWKYEEREIVKTESPANRIDTAHQGRLHVLVILSSDGNIAIRDAETGLLIRFIQIYVKHPSWMTVCNDLAYLSSSDKSLIILDIMTGRVEKRLYLSSHATGLAVYEDNIFAISYNGIINCFNKDMCTEKKLYYGAEKNGLTCVHVYQDWVFTGNRKGNVSLFQFDPNSSIRCEFGKCDNVYGLKEDLEYHVENDHLLKKKNLLKCFWRGCSYFFSRVHDINGKMDHLKMHIYQEHL